MKTSVITTQPFSVVGSQIRTTNKDNQAMHDIPAAWQTFFSKNLHNTIPNQADPGTLFAVYTDYDPAMVAAVKKTKTNVVPDDYTFIIAPEVTTLDLIPNGLISHTIPAGRYAVITAQGPYPDALIQAWQFIWSPEFPYVRAYTVDFEKYDHRKFNGDQNSIVEIYIAIE